MRHLAILIVLLFSGCNSQITNIGPLLPKEDMPVDFITPQGERKIFRDYNRTIDSFLRYHFTDKAYSVLKDIPVIDGICYKPYAGGVNFWSNLISLICFNGIGRKIIIEKEMIKTFGEDGLKHEFVHQLDDMDRDGEGEWIDHDEFRKAYDKLSGDYKLLKTDNNKHIKIYKYASVINYIEKQSNDWITNTFGIGDMSEHIAYSTRFLFSGAAPDYFKRVFRKIFRELEDL